MVEPGMQPGPPGHEPGDQDPAARRVLVTRVLATAVGTALFGLIPNPPQSLTDWLMFGVGVVLVAIGVGGLPAVQWSPLDWLPLPIRVRHVVWSGIAVLVAVAIGFTVPVLVDLAESVNISMFGCTHPTELRVLASAEGLDPARQLAERYTRSTAEANHGCPAVHAYTYAASPRRSSEALTANWSAEHLRDVGPRPDVWLTDSAPDVDLVKAAPTGNPVAEDFSVASSPIVLGIAGPAAPAIGPTRHGLPWLELVDKATAIDRAPVRPDPNSSVPGAVATAILYGAATPVDPARARLVEQRIGRALDRDGYPLGNGLDLLCRHRQVGNPRATVITSEQALVRFNQGAPLGESCVTAEPRRPADTAMLAYYPSDTRAMDYRFARMTWSYPAQQRTATDFGRWLTSDAGKRALVEVGLRPPGLTVGEPLSEQNGVLPGAPFTREPVAGEPLRAALAEYDNAQRPARVLLALDASGSMAAPAGQGLTRFQVAGQGVRSALRLMSAQDEFGLRLFSGAAAGSPIREPVPLGPRDGPVGALPRRDATALALDQTAPSGATPLLWAIRDSVAALGPGGEDRVGAVVVLTDGADTSSDVTLGQVREAVAGKGVRVFAIAVGEARCTADALRVLTSDTGGACHDADQSTVDAKLGDVFGALWGKGPR